MKIYAFERTVYGIFEHDLTSCHKSKLVETFMLRKEINFLNWFRIPPDLNTIDNLWAILNKRLGKMDCATK